MIRLITYLLSILVSVCAVTQVNVYGKVVDKESYTKSESEIEVIKITGSFPEKK